MSTILPQSVRRLAQPRSRRSKLWACVYCGAFNHDDAAESDDVGPTPGAD